MPKRRPVRRPRLLAAGLALGVAALALVAPPASARTAALPDPATPTFGVPRVVDPIHVYGEPDIAVNPKTGAIHASGPQGTGTQRSIWNISVDNGDSYRIVQNLPVSTYPTAAVPTKSAIALGGGDTDIVFDRAGKAYFTDLAALLCFSSTNTADDGATTAPANPRACPTEAATDDRQWMGVFDPIPGDQTVSAYTGSKPLVYMSWNGGSHKVASSTDGLDYSHLAGAAAGSLSAYPVVDQHTGDFLVPVSGSGGRTRLAVGVPNASGDLTFHYNNMPLGTTRGTLFPILTQDTARNLYMVYIKEGSAPTQWQAWYTWAPPGDDNEWKDWSTPVQISAPPANVNVFPWAKAGGPGILNVAWYGTEATLDDLGTAGPSARAGQAWNLFFNQVTSANSSAPVSHQVVASPHPMHYNDICLQGTGCITGQGNRNMADFFMVTLGSDGRARIVYDDTSNALVQGVQDTAADHQGAALVTVVTQNTGINSWTGETLSPTETTQPVNGTSDPGGDALFKPLGGTNVPSADIKDLRLSIAGGNIVITATTAGGLLSDAAKAGGVPFAELVVRWQRGNTLYHAAVEMPAGAPAAGALFFAGQTKSVDLCSVSGCKPNYLVYNAPPQLDTSRVNGSINTTVPGQTTYNITVPLSAVSKVGDASSLYEEVMAFVTVSPVSYAKPQDNALAFADEVPLQIEGTRTFNFKTGAEAAPDVPEAALVTLLPMLGLLVLGAGYALRRRDRLA
ncbi:MAG: hypothetical protein JJD92_01305 [Frankiaceae bacterium]|nr:hypothetical protein [Frankiaceae bacterium]